MLNTRMHQTISSQLSVDQGEGIPPAIFERCTDSESGAEWRKMIMKKVQQFAVAIKIDTGYDVFLRRTHRLKDGLVVDADILHADIRQAGQKYVFIVSDNECHVVFYKEVR